MPRRRRRDDGGEAGRRRERRRQPAGAPGAFALGTHAHTVIAMLGSSLDYVAALGLPAIQRHPQELTDRLKRELPRRGYKLTAPPEVRTPIVACQLADARGKLGPAMAAAKVKLPLSTDRFRLTPSVQNGHQDANRFLAAPPRA